MPRSRPSSGRAPAKAPTIFDVAALAGVSKSTVSNVVRGGDGVAPATRARVQGAVERLGYRPNGLARQLVRQRTNIVGVLVGDLANPFYAQLARGVERCAAARGYRVMFSNIEEDETAVEALLEQRVAGFVFLALPARAPAVDPGVPAVFAGLRERSGDSVAVSDRAGARLATEHLLALGHRRIAYVTTPAVEARADRARRDGYRSALVRAGIAPRPVVRWSDGAPRFGPDPPTAAFCSNDLGAIALLEHCDRVGLRIPDDLSVVGFDNIALAGLARISLTTVAQPLDDLARLALDMLASRLERAAPGARRHVTVPATLVVRGSTGRPSSR